MDCSAARSCPRMRIALAKVGSCWASLAARVASVCHEAQDCACVAGSLGLVVGLDAALAHPTTAIVSITTPAAAGPLLPSAGVPCRQDPSAARCCSFSLLPLLRMRSSVLMDLREAAVGHL